MKMKAHRALKCLIPVILFLTGCIGIQPEEQKPQLLLITPESEENIHTETKTPQIEIAPSVYPSISPSPSLTALPSATKAQFDSDETGCLVSEDKGLEGAALKGVLVLESVDNENPKKHFLLDLQTGLQTSLDPTEKEDISNLTVSPGGNLLAYRRWVYDETTKGPIESSIVIADSNGNIVASYPAKYNFDQKNPVSSRIGNWERFYWLDEQHLAIKVFETDVLTTVILNVLSGDSQTIQADFPKIDPLAEFSVTWDLVTVFDNTISKVMYIGQTDDDFGPALLLYDITADQILFLRKMQPAFGRPQWSPDFNTIIFAGSSKENTSQEAQELFLVDLEGNVEQLTWLSDTYQAAIIGKFNWSPDGMFISFWFTDAMRDSLEDELAILNMEDGDATRLCVEGRFKDAIIWSPDSDNLIINRYTSEAYSGEVLIANIEQGSLFTLAQGMVSRGWMKAAP